jgi:hypothetical protein
MERDLQQVVDEKEELVNERDVYRLKYDRLNKELNYILKGDERRVLDVDALIMENRFQDFSPYHREAIGFVTKLIICLTTSRQFYVNVLVGGLEREG